MPMRSMRRPAGLPWKELVDRFKGSAKVVQEKLDLHNFMANLAAEECCKAVMQGRFVVLENPAQSYIWELPAFKELAGMKGMVWITCHNCAHGGKRRKYTGFLTNVPGAQEALGVLCSAREEDAPCDFSGVPHLPWTASWKDGRVETLTAPEAQYPTGMCVALAKLIAACPDVSPALASQMPYAFLEVFSGPEAPLTQAVRSALAGRRAKPTEDENGPSLHFRA